MFERNTDSTRRTGRYGLAAVALAAACVAPAAQAKQNSGQDWLWLSSTLDAATCTFTTTVTWNGFRQAKTLEVFATEGYTGSKLVSTFAPVQSKTTTATVTLAPLAVSATATTFYPWAQLLDSHGVPIPASLDFSGPQVAYCAAP